MRDSCLTKAVIPFQGNIINRFMTQTGVAIETSWVMDLGPNPAPSWAKHIFVLDQSRSFT